MKFMTLFLLLLSSSVIADCRVSEERILNIRQSHVAFVKEKNRKNAQIFLESIPDQFCNFEAIFGYSREFGPMPLYDFPLYESLPDLPKYVPIDSFAEKLVSLASGGSWDADNIGLLQNVYINLLSSDPEAVVEELENLENLKRRQAIEFLFDGPHPSNLRIEESLLSRICSENRRICEEMELVFHEMSSKEHVH